MVRRPRRPSFSHREFTVNRGRDRRRKAKPPSLTKFERHALSERAKALWLDPEYRERMLKILRDGLKAKWQDPAYRKRMQKTLRENRRRLGRMGGKATPFERAVAAALPFRVQHQKQIGRYRADLYVARLRLVIECDEEYWHSLPGRKARDRKRDAYLRALGYHVIRIRYDEFKKDPERIGRAVSALVVAKAQQKGISGGKKSA